MHERPDEQSLRGVYQEMVRDNVEFYLSQPNLRVEPDGPGGEFQRVRDLTRDDLERLARRQAGMAVERVMRERKATTVA